MEKAKGKKQMKKLMIAAAAAAMIGGAYAAELCEEDEVAGCLAYDIKISVKTPVSKTMKCTDKSICGGTTKDCVTYAVLGKKTFNGFLWACEYDCTSYGDLAGFNFALWEKATKTGVVTINSKSGLPQNFGSITMSRFGKKAEQVQVLFNINEDDQCYGDDVALDIQLAGFGKWDKKSECMKSASGTVTGTRSLATAERYLNGCNDEAPRFLAICDDFDSWCDYSGTETADDLVCSGNFTMKINSKAGKGNKSWTAFVPAYARCK